MESLCILYLLYHWSLGNQRKCAGLLFIIPKPCTSKWAYTDSSNLTYTVTRHTTGGYFAAQGDKPRVFSDHWRSPVSAKTTLPSVLSDQWRSPVLSRTVPYWVFFRTSDVLPCYRGLYHTGCSFGPVTFSRVIEDCTILGVFRTSDVLPYYRGLLHTECSFGPVTFSRIIEDCTTIHSGLSARWRFPVSSKIVPLQLLVWWRM